MARDLSDSYQHTVAERLLLDLAEQKLRVRLESKSMRLENGATFHLDGVNERAKVLCEVFSHLGDLKDGQKKKLARDVLKLITVERIKGEPWRKVICVADEPAQRYLVGRSWCAAAVREFDFGVLLFALKPGQQRRLAKTQVREARGVRR